MPSSQDVRDPQPAPDHHGASAADVDLAEAEARYHHERLALYKARVHSGKPTSLARLRELERSATRSDASARRVRGR